MTRRSCTYPMDSRAYLDRPPERLALRGYRGWTWTVASRSAEPWKEVCRLYRADLAAHAEMALQALSDFVETLGLCATCPLGMRRSGSYGLCRDEALMLALLAAIQHGDDQAVERSVGSICCTPVADRVACAAGVFALTLKAVDRVLLPIPVQVIDDIRSRSGDAVETAAQSITLH